MTDCERIREAARNAGLDIEEGLWHLWSLDGAAPEHLVDTAKRGFTSQGSAHFYVRKRPRNIKYMFTDPKGRCVPPVGQPGEEH